MNNHCPPRYRTKLDALRAITGEATRIHGRRKMGRGERLIATRCEKCKGWHIFFIWARPEGVA